MISHENRTAIAWPESDAQGLIPFCLENLQLKIERRVSFWRNALPSGYVPLFYVVHGMTRLEPISAAFETLRNEDISPHCIAPWITVALILPDMGMPPHAFSLTFECDGCPEKSRQVFETVKRDAVWQTAFERWNAANLDQKPRPWQKFLSHSAYVA
ncbi:hypothetical protein CC86DRAFT_370648 [Ophiobolus disseminans]|uniref:Uncharacterized protein n=1 Tax=Ophiobolus disseminans TaxID=1469910 RepID=A0A6A6ZZ78_9PLEO|nr:hypothetical protein CC86DRAFT_370648 [Ophiobolus disseminans]